MKTKALAYRPAYDRLGSIRILSTALLFLQHHLRPALAKTIRCTNTTALHAALASVGPGDEIILAPGMYYDEDGISGTASHFPAQVDGMPNARITLRGEDPANKPLLSGSDAGSRTVLRVFGDYWTVKDLAVTNGQKGIIFDNANYGQILNCHVYGIGYEAIHIRDGSDHCLVEGCNVHDTGLRNKGFGEAIYVGTDRGSWGRYDPYVWNTTIRNCTLGPNVSAEAFDIKEGTQETRIEFNTVDATGISDANYADSFIDLKAARTIVRYNTFIRNGAEKLKKGIAIIYRGTEYSAYEHAIHDNYFYLDGVSNIKLVDSYSGSRDIYAFNNIREPSSAADEDYARIVITECCPHWYTPPSDGNGVCTAPFGLVLTEVTNTSAVLNWSVVGSNTTTYVVQYQEYGEVYPTSFNSSETSVAVFNLNPSTVYSWKVSSVCGDRSSAPASGPAFLTLDNGDDDPPPPPGALQVYTDGLIGFWTDYGWGGIYDFESSLDSKVGAFSISAAYAGYGGINLKHSRGGVDASNLVAVRFWVKGDSTNGPGNPTLQLRVNSQDYDFEIINGVWSIFQIPLDIFGSPSTIEALVLQNRQPGELLVYVDQFELLAADETEEPTGQPSSPVITPDPTASRGPTPSPSPFPSNGPSPESTVSPTSITTPLPTVRPSLAPVKVSTPSPTDLPTSPPTAQPSLAPVQAHTDPPADCVLVCTTPSPVSISSPTPAPGAAGSGTYIIYDEIIASGWEDFSYTGTFDASSTMEAHSGSKSFRADIGGWGALNLKATSPGVLLSELASDADATNVSLRFWVKSSGSGIVLRVRVNGKMYDTTVSPSGQWTNVSLPLSLFYSPDSVYQVEIQNRASGSVLLYFDAIELHKNTLF